MNQVYLRGCESTYLGDLVDKESICPRQDPLQNRGAGSLVMHIRSGDIFDRQNKGHLGGYGQVFSSQSHRFMPPVISFLVLQIVECNTREPLVSGINAETLAQGT